MASETDKGILDLDPDVFEDMLADNPDAQYEEDHLLMADDCPLGENDWHSMVLGDERLKIVNPDRASADASNPASPFFFGGLGGG